VPIIYGLGPRQIWRGLEDYQPVFAVAAIPGGGGVDVVNYVGRGILMSTQHAIGANPVATRIDIDGVTLVNSANVPEVSSFFIAFDISLYVRMVSGGGGGGALVVYLHE